MIEWRRQAGGSGRLDAGKIHKIIIPAADLSGNLELFLASLVRYTDGATRFQSRCFGTRGQASSTEGDNCIGSMLNCGNSAGGIWRSLRGFLANLPYPASIQTVETANKKGEFLHKSCPSALI
jgi:hypothetical protein